MNSLHKMSIVIGIVLFLKILINKNSGEERNQKKELAY